MKIHLLSSILRCLSAMLFWLSFQSDVLAQEAYPTVWQLVPCQTAEGEWRQALQVQTVPGVVYRLQRSTLLTDWTNIDSRYGMGQEWICPVLPSNGPPVGTLPQEVLTLPVQPAEPMRQAQLILQKSATGEPVISWLSLDDGSMKQKFLTSTTLDPAWDDFEGFYLYPHGNFFFALSPNLSSTPTIINPAPTLGPIDQLMVSTFQSSLPQITANITSSIEMAKTYSPAQANTENKAFYRIVADWAVDSNGGGRYDWQQLILDGTDPFAPAEGGVDAAATPAGSSGYPVPGAVAPVAPLAHFEQQMMSLGSIFELDLVPNPGSEGPPQGEVFSYDVDLSDEEYFALRNATTYEAFKQEVDKLSFSGVPWAEDGLQNFSNRRRKWANLDSSGNSTSNAITFQYTRTRFRLKIDGVAPAGGYHIPLRIGILRQDVATGSPETVSFPPAVTGDALYVDLNFICPENQSVSEAIEFDSITNMDDNKRITFVPASITTRENDIIVGGNVGGATTGPVPENGTCVVENEAFMADFGNRYAPNLTNYEGTPLKVYWQKKQLNGSGTLGEWAALTMSGYESLPHEGTHTYIQARHKGIYQLQAVLTLPNGSEIEYPFVRMRDGRSIKNSKNISNGLLKAGQSDYFGVSGNSISKNVRDAAVGWLGSTTYAFKNEIMIEPLNIYNPNMENRSKCNVFVTHISNNVGATTPYYYRKLFIPTAPIAKDDWHNEPELNIDLDGPGWHYQAIAETPFPGMSVASPAAGGDSATSGHVGILDYDGSWINAGKLNVNKSVHIMDNSEDYKPNHMRAR